MVMLVSDSAALPLLVRVMVCVGAASLIRVPGNARLVGDKLTVEPVPLSETVSGDP